MTCHIASLLSDKCGCAATYILMTPEQAGQEILLCKVIHREIVWIAAFALY